MRFNGREGESGYPERTIQTTLSSIVYHPDIMTPLADCKIGSERVSLPFGSIAMWANFSDLFSYTLKEMVVLYHGLRSAPLGNWVLHPKSDSISNLWTIGTRPSPEMGPQTCRPLPPGGVEAACETISVCLEVGYHAQSEIRARWRRVALMFRNKPVKKILQKDFALDSKEPNP